MRVRVSVGRRVGNTVAWVRQLPSRTRAAVAAVCLFLILVWWTTPRDPATGTVRIYGRDNTLLFELAGNVGRKQPVAYDTFPPYLVAAVVAAEDERYWTHPGIDAKAIVRSMGINVRAGTIVSGASTIPQQVTRLGSPPASAPFPVRVVTKLREAVAALRLSAAYPKKEILTTYLNGVYLGNHNYGFQAAARFYFRKNVDKLSLGESAYLAGMIASPSRYDPYTHPDEGERRKRYVLERMGAAGAITAERIAETAASREQFGTPDVTIVAPHFVDYVMEQLTALGIRQRGISVYTTLDPGMFSTSLASATRWVDQLKKDHDVTNCAVVVLDNGTGAILSMVGGITYFGGSNTTVNMAVRPRQPGSSIKPVTYAAAFSRGMTPATLLYDVKKQYLTKRGEGFIPNNFGDTYHGLVLAREALASSYNLPAVEMLSRIGIPAFTETARALGITTYRNAEAYDLSVTLGANEVPLIELSNAYATLARGGMYLPVHAIDRVTDLGGRTVYRHPAETPVQRLGENGERIAYLITDILSDPEARMPGFGESNYLTLSRPAAVKTGTTTDWHDVWTVGYTPAYTVGVWMGNTDNTPMRSISSATGAAPVWNQIMDELHAGKPAEPFVRPDGVVEREICSLTGGLYDGICPERKTELFIRGTEPTAKSSMHVKAVVDVRNGLLATAACPESVTETRVFVEYPQEVYSWAVEHGRQPVPVSYSPLCGTPGAAVDEKPPYVAVTSPKTKSVYQNAPLLIQHQGIQFTVNVSSNVRRVVWYVDGVRFASADSLPFSVIWPLRTGSHTVYAEAVGAAVTQRSETVPFTVVQQ